jgi:hypothetical protein
MAKRFMDVSPGTDERGPKTRSAICVDLLSPSGGADYVISARACHPSRT